MPVKQDYFKWNGWGFKDSGFEYDKQIGSARVMGNRYMFGGSPLPALVPYFAGTLELSPEHTSYGQKDIEIDPPNINKLFVEELGEQNFSRRSFEKWERVMHSHGADLEAMYQLRNSRLDKYIDMVVYPYTQEHCEILVKLAAKHNVMLVPMGGGTNVTKALTIPKNEQRMTVSVDMERMQSILWVDKENNMACVQAGKPGRLLERDLAQYGMTTGHEPDSMEFSTVGGWVSTRASGMKKNTYGNIEDIICNVTIVTPSGTYKKTDLYPRSSNGPDLTNIVMGSEGNMGIITDATFRIRPLPQKVIYESIILPDFETGIKLMHHVSKNRNIWPTSMRLVDNTQFQFGTTLKPPSDSKWQDFIDKAKKFFVVNIKGYDPERLAAVTLAFEGEASWCDLAHKQVLEIAKQY